MLLEVSPNCGGGGREMSFKLITFLSFWSCWSCGMLILPFVSQWSEDDEIADYKQNSEWMDECHDGMFEAWYEKIGQAEPEKQRKVRICFLMLCHR